MLLDTAAMYFRAFHGVPDTVRSPDGQPVNAIRGLLDMIAKLVTDFRPTELVACWDDEWRPKWRVALIPSYKAQRVASETKAGWVEEVPELLTAQIPIVREVLDALGIPIIGAADHEADDVIGTLAHRARIPVDVVTGDRDLFQVVDDSHSVRVIYTGRGMSKLQILTDAALKAKYGISPQQYADFAVMRGDPSDGLPGVAGIGEKTAVSLLNSWDDLDGIIAAAMDDSSSMTSPIRSKIRAAADYLTVAPKVVEVARDLEMPPFDARIRPRSPEQSDVLDDLSERWGLGGSLQRARHALDSVPSS
jgi:5'-3' exonuclease